MASQLLITKYLAKFENIRDFLKVNNITSTVHLVKKFKGSGYIYTFLRQSNVIQKKDDGFFMWNPMIPITNKLVKTAVDYMTVRNKFKNDPTPLEKLPEYKEDADVIKDWRAIVSNKDLNCIPDIKQSSYPHKELMDKLGLLVVTLPKEIKVRVITLNKRIVHAKKGDLIKELKAMSVVLEIQIQAWYDKLPTLRSKGNDNPQERVVPMGNDELEDYIKSPAPLLDFSEPFVERTHRDSDKKERFTVGEYDKVASHRELIMKFDSLDERVAIWIDKYNENNNLTANMGRTIADAMQVVEKVVQEVTVKPKRKFTVLWGVINIEW